MPGTHDAPTSRSARASRRIRLLSIAALSVGFTGVGLSSTSGPGDPTVGPRFRSVAPAHLVALP